MVKKSKGYSTSQVSAEVLERRSKAIKATWLPKGTRLDVVQNSGDHVDRSVENVEEALVEGALLTVLVVFLFLNSWRSTVITGLALPGVGALELHRRVRVWLYAEHDVAAWPIARDRYSDR